MNCLKNMVWKRSKANISGDVFVIERLIRKCIVFGFKVFIEKFSNSLFVGILLKCRENMIGCILMRSSRELQA